jgi:hypothetical protein
MVVCSLSQVHDVRIFKIEGKDTGRLEKSCMHACHNNDPKYFSNASIDWNVTSPIRLLMTSGNHYDALIPKSKLPIDYFQWREGEHLDDFFAKALSVLINS